MEASDFLQKTAENIAGFIDAKKAYGNPVQAGNKTVIPVSTAWWCGGGGGGEGVGSSEVDVDEGGAGNQEGSGGGFGGFGLVRPVGYIILEEKEVTWKRIIDLNRLVLLATVVLLCWLRVLRYWIKAKTAQEISERQDVVNSSRTR